MMNESQAKLIDTFTANGTKRGRPTFVVMIDPRAMDEELERYRFTPEDNEVQEQWAGQETVYLKFTTEQECRAKLKKHLA